MLRSDAHRKPKLAAFSVLVFGLCFYSYRLGMTDASIFHAYFESPGTGDGRVLPFPYAKIITVDGTLAEVWIKGHTYRVETGDRHFLPGTKISFEAVKTGPSRVRMLRCHVHALHKMKLYVSFIPMLIVFRLIGRRYRFDLRRLMFTERV